MDKSTVKLHSGNEMPALGLGTWQLTKDTAGTVAYALGIGYRMIDTSSDYRTQPRIGEAIRNSNVNRESIYVVTKVEETDDSYKRTKSNLRELGLDFADLLLIHRPPFRGAGERLWEGLIQAKEEGLIRDIGVSNYSIDLINNLIEASDAIPAVNQIEWSPFGHSEEMKQYCERNKIIIQAYSPLTRAKRLDDEWLLAIAQRHHKTAAQILIRWNIEQGYVPLPKANQRQHLEENIDVFDFELPESDIIELNNFNQLFSSLTYLPYI